MQAQAYLGSESYRRKSHLSASNPSSFQHSSEYEGEIQRLGRDQEYKANKQQMTYLPTDYWGKTQAGEVPNLRFPVRT